MTDRKTAKLVGPVQSGRAGVGPAQSLRRSSKVHDDLLRNLNQQVKVFGKNPPDDGVTTFSTKEADYRVKVDWVDTTHRGAIKVVATTSDSMLAEILRAQKWTNRISTATLVENDNRMQVVTFFYQLPVR